MWLAVDYGQLMWKKRLRAHALMSRIIYLSFQLRGPKRETPGLPRPYRLMLICCLYPLQMVGTCAWGKHDVTDSVTNTLPFENTSCLPLPGITIFKYSIAIVMQAIMCFLLYISLHHGELVRERVPSNPTWGAVTWSHNSWIKLLPAILWWDPRTLILPSRFILASWVFILTH